MITLVPLLSSSAPNLPSFPSVQVLTNPELRSDAVLGYLKQTALLLLPALALSALFFSSTNYTEAITKKKYPVAYAAYQKRVGMFLPFKAIVTELAGGKEKEQTDKLIWGEFYGDGSSKVSKSE